MSSEIFLRVPLNKSKLNGRGGSIYKYDDARKANLRRDTMLSSWSSKYGVETTEIHARSVAAA